MDSRSACIQGVLKVKVKVKGHVIRALLRILGMSYSVIDGLVCMLQSRLYRRILTCAVDAYRSTDNVFFDDYVACVNKVSLSYTCVYFTLYK